MPVDVVGVVAIVSHLAIIGCVGGGRIAVHCQGHHRGIVVLLIDGLLGGHVTSVVTDGKVDGVDAVGEGVLANGTEGLQINRHRFTGHSGMVQAISHPIVKGDIGVGGGVVVIICKCNRCCLYIIGGGVGHLVRDFCQASVAHLGGG